MTINALTAADEAIIPVQAEYYALEGLSQLTAVVRRVREALNPTLHISGVLVTMFDGRTRLAIEVLDELEKFFPQQMFKTQIPRNIRLSEAPSYGKPVILFDVKSRGAQAYISLAKELLGARRVGMSQPKRGLGTGSARCSAIRRCRPRPKRTACCVRFRSRAITPNPFQPRKHFDARRARRSADLDRGIRRARADHRAQAR